MPDTDLNPDGPHSPDRTRGLGNVLAECVRVLNYATMRGEDGLKHPSDAHDLIAALYTATQRMPQLLGQMAAWLETVRGNPALADSYAGNVPGHAATAREAAGEAIEYLAEAADFAGELTQVLRAAQNTTGGLYVKEDTDV